MRAPKQGTAVIEESNRNTPRKLREEVNSSVRKKKDFECASGKKKARKKELLGDPSKRRYIDKSNALLSLPT